MSQIDVAKVLFAGGKAPKVPTKLTQTEALVFAIRYWITTNSISIWKLNRMLGFTDNRLRDIMSPDWNPTYHTLVVIEKLIVKTGLADHELAALRQPSKRPFRRG